METGLRGKFSQTLKWNFALYQTINTNDILYLNAPGGSQNVGYFSNVGTTRRQGLELGLSGLAFEKLNWYISYGFVDATYQSSVQLNNAYGAENVKAGDKIPTIPQNTFKFGSEYEFFHNFFLGGDLQYSSGQYARGDDQNIYPQIPAYTLVNLNSRYVLTKNVELFAMGRNVLDNHYVSFGQMSTNLFNSGNATQFQGPGAPATGYAGVRIHWD
jgi:outer membrane receptor protein involved in Fe transport